MRQIKKLELAVGIFVLLSAIAFLVLALKISNLGFGSTTKGYTVIAIFDNVGNLKARAPITISGVRVGRVTHIGLDPKTFKASVTLHIDEKQKHLPSDSSASIYTQGLLGSNYVNLSPGFDDQHFLKEGSRITNTHSALILENLIGQFLFSIKKSDQVNHN